MRRDFRRAVNRPAPVELSEPAAKELGRLGVSLKKLRADVVRPGFKVEGTDGETMTSMMWTRGRGSPWSLLTTWRAT